MDLKSLNNNTPRVFDFETLVNKAIDLSRAYTTEKDISFNNYSLNSGIICEYDDYKIKEIKSK